MTACRIVMTAGISVAVAVITILWFSSKKKKKPSTSTRGSDKHSSSSKTSVEKDESPQAASSEEQFSFKHTDLAVEELSANTFSAKEFSVTTASSESSSSLKKEAALRHHEPCKHPELLNSAVDEKYDPEENEDAPLQNEQNEMAAISVTTKSPDVGKSAKSSSEEEASTKEVQAVSKEENTTTDEKDHIPDEPACKDDDDDSDALKSCTDCEKNVEDECSDKQGLSTPISSAVPSKGLSSPISSALSSKVCSNDSDNLNCGPEHKLEESSLDTSLQPQVTSIEAEKSSPSAEPSQEPSSSQLESSNSQGADRVQTSSQGSSLSESSTDGSAVDDETLVGKDASCDASSNERITDIANDITECTHSSSDEVQSVPTSDWGTAVEELERKSKQKKMQSPKTRKSSGEVDSQKSPSPTPVDTPLVSPGSEVSSEVSNDSGRSTMDNGAASTASSSTHQDQAGVLEEDQIITWKINFPSDLCGRLIGKQGRNIKWLMDRTGCNIYIRKSPDFMQWCCLEGTQSEVDHALDLIGRKFPTVDMSAVEDSPNTDSSDISQRCVDIIPVLPPQLQLQLTEGLNDVIVCNIMDASHIFVQQHIHPTFPALATLDHCMAICYADQTLVPGVPKPVDIGVICVAPSPMAGAYCRAEVREVMDDTDSVVVKFCDYGGYYHVPRDVLRQIRSDFMTLPFQAVECYMANIAPLEGEESFSLEATGLVEELTQGIVTQVNVVGYSTEGCPLVHLYSTQGDTSIMVNRVMVEQGLAQWIEG